MIDDLEHMVASMETEAIIMIGIATRIKFQTRYIHVTSQVLNMNVKPE